MLDNDKIKTIIEEKFFDNIYAETSEFFSNSPSVCKIETDFDFLELDSIDIGEIIQSKVELIDKDLEVSGTIEVVANLDAYAYWDKKNEHIGTIEKKVYIDFVFYIKDEIVEDFEVLNLHVY